MTHLTEFQLNEYLDGMMGEADRQATDTHLASCVDCQAALAELQSVFFALNEAAEIALTTDLTVRVLADLQPPASELSRWLRPLLLAQMTAVIGMVIWLWPTVWGWFVSAETAVRQLPLPTLPSLADLWARLAGWETAVSQQLQLTRPAIPLANNQWTLLVILALAAWLVGNRWLFITEQE